MFNEISFTFLLCVFLIDAYMVRNDLGKLSTNLCSTINCIGSMIKIWILNSKKKEAERIRIKLDNNLNLANIGDSTDDQKIIERNSRNLALITAIFYAMGFPLVIFWLAFPMLDNTEQRRFPVPFIDFPKIKESPIYEIIYSYHAVTLITFFFNILSYDMIFYGFLVRICAQLEILKKNFGKINDLYPKINFARIIDGYHEAKEDDWFENDGPLENVIQMKVNSIYSSDMSAKNQFELMIKNKDTARWRCDETVKIIEENIIHHQVILE